ncbi:hypothetical protein M501DRAFT_929926 [Patellaria atrata CBS 101060]|uniref:GIT Spa2 homology (SHD) domain-containing protein n=1 Tax=Patellaria atrata CBS 101060 TaxID=1346257 RepID=A0A9P4SEG9_9PEZI|nr:hypothetical protein M501DRAFT_929926 [Patellaria atrata CBS 101060]
MAGRNGTLSPISVEGSNDWSPLSRYQNLNGSDNPYSPSITSNRGPLVTPPASVHTSTSTTDGGMQNGMGRRTTSNGQTSPSSSVARSSSGTGLYAPSMADSNISSRKALMIEEALLEHHNVLKGYLAPYLKDEKGNAKPNRARDKLLRLSAGQFQELSTDVYDELLRREEERKNGGPNSPANDTPKFLLPKQNFHPKRNQARQKLSTLPLERFQQLATDVFYELERRFPRFLGPDIERRGSPTGSVASSQRVPSRAGTTSSMGSAPPNFRGPPPRAGPPYRNTPPMGNGGLGVPDGSNSFGRPLPKTFQSNTIIPNKSTMVEDDDDQSGLDEDDDDQDAFGLEGAARRESKRNTTKSLAQQSSKLVEDLQVQISDLQAKVNSLETSLRDKDEEMELIQNTGKDRDNVYNKERDNWSDLQYSLEQKVEEAQRLNTSLQSELERMRIEKESSERDLRMQLDEARQESARGNRSNDDGEWRERYENLEKELEEQQQITEDVRRDASQFLQEMRSLSEQSHAAVEKEERLGQQVTQLENEIRDWKSRYARIKTQLRTFKASSIGLAAQNSNVAVYVRDTTFTHPEGLVKDVQVTKFQLSVDELLQAARKTDPDAMLECMKGVVICVRNITGDMDTADSQSVYSDSADTPKLHAKLKSRVSATANNLITASKNHAAAGGLSPVSLLDAAASHLTTAVIELIRAVKIRPTPSIELEDEHREEDDKPMPLTKGYLGLQNGLGHIRHRSRGGSTDSAGYSSTGSPRRSEIWSSRRSEGAGTSPLTTGGSPRDSGLEIFKNYLEDQTAILVHSIQPLVHSIRSNPNSSHDDEAITSYVSEISTTVHDIANKTQEAINSLKNSALAKHAPPVIDALEECRRGLVEVERGGRKAEIPPLAFRIARATKELVLRVDRIESGELTSDMSLPSEF